MDVPVSKIHGLKDNISSNDLSYWIVLLDYCCLQPRKKKAFKCFYYLMQFLKDSFICYET